MTFKFSVALTVVMASLLFISCSQSDSDRFLGFYNMEENSNDTTFVVIHNNDSDAYVANFYTCE